eukprot:m.84219 g.84219  ORF g.84219 m.84219 type:complete len:122 (-) comp14793_c1_seq4:124-489(-)
MPVCGCALAVSLTRVVSDQKDQHKRRQHAFHVYLWVQHQYNKSCTLLAVAWLADMTLFLSGQMTDAGQVVGEDGTPSRPSSSVKAKPTFTPLLDNFSEAYAGVELQLPPRLDPKARKQRKP